MTEMNAPSRASIMSRRGCSISTTRSTRPTAICSRRSTGAWASSSPIASASRLHEAQSLRETYYYEHGTTLAGLVRLHGVPPDDFLDYVHDIDLSAVRPLPELAAALAGAARTQIHLHQRLAQTCRGRGGAARRGRPVRGYLRHSRARLHLPEADARGLSSASSARTASMPRQAAMFDDLPHNLETAHAIGMTTVLVHGLTEHPEHQAMAGWTELPAHIHHRTDALAPFLAAIGAALGADEPSLPPARPCKRNSASPDQARHDPRSSQDLHRQRLRACRRDHAGDQGRGARRGRGGARSPRQGRAQGGREARRRTGSCING